jgi:hypothetical protein
MREEGRLLMKYKFRVGDYVEDVTGRIGYISSFCKCKFCKERGFYEPHVVYNNGDFDYITVYEYKKGFPSYKRIGQYDFTKKAEDKDDDKIEPLCEEYTKSFPICEVTNMGYTSECYSFDLGVVGKKINELIEAVNELRNKND